MTLQAWAAQRRAVTLPASPSGGSSAPGDSPWRELLRPADPSSWPPSAPCEPTAAAAGQGGRGTVSRRCSPSFALDGALSLRAATLADAAQQAETLGQVIGTGLAAPPAMAGRPLSLGSLASGAAPAAGRHLLRFASAPTQPTAALPLVPTPSPGAHDLGLAAPPHSAAGQSLHECAVCCRALTRCHVAFRDQAPLLRVAGSQAGMCHAGSGLSTILGPASPFSPDWADSSAAWQGGALWGPGLCRSVGCSPADAVPRATGRMLASAVAVSVSPTAQAAPPELDALPL